MPYQVVKRGDKWLVQKPDGKSFGEHDSKAEAEKQLAALYANEPKAMRALHLVGATSGARTEWLGDREYLVVPTVALIGDNVIHAVNAPEAEFVPASILSAEGWERKPLMLGHPTRNGRQISANDPDVLRASSFGFTANPKVNGKRLGVESWCDVKKLEALGQSQLLADLRAGKPVEVSTGSFVETRPAAGTMNGKRYATEWASIGPDHLAFLPGGVGACSVAMGCGAHRAAMRVMEGSDELRDAGGVEGHEFHGKLHPRSSEGRKMNTMQKLKERVLALFDSPEAAAAEEAAELVAYNSMRTLFDGVGDKWDEASALIDALIADEENPTVTPGQEEAEEEVEDARLDALRMLCYAMIAELQSVCNACIEQQVPEPMPASDPRYAEALRDLDNPEGINQYTKGGGKTATKDADKASTRASDAKASYEYNKSAPGMKEQYEAEQAKAASAHDKAAAYHDKLNNHAQAAYHVKKANEHRKEIGQGAKDARGASRFRYLVGKEISAKNLKTVQAAHDASHDMHAHTVALGAQCDEMKVLAGKDCPECEGTGQITKDGKQQDCPACEGEGMRSAEDGGQSAEGGQMTKEQRAAEIAKLVGCPCSGFTAADVKVLEAADDATIERFRAAADARKKEIDDLKAAQAQAEADLKAAQAAQIPAEELTQLRALADERKAKDAAEKADLVAKLEPLKTLSKEQLEAKPLDELRTLAAFAKVPTPDFSAKGMPMPRAAAQADSYAPPDPYNLKALQGKKEAVN